MISGIYPITLKVEVGKFGLFFLPFPTNFLPVYYMVFVIDQEVRALGRIFLGGGV